MGAEVGRRQGVTGLDLGLGTWRRGGFPNRVWEPGRPGKEEGPARQAGPTGGNGVSDRGSQGGRIAGEGSRGGAEARSVGWGTATRAWGRAKATNRRQRRERRRGRAEGGRRKKDEEIAESKLAFVSGDGAGWIGRLASCPPNAASQCCEPHSRRLLNTLFSEMAFSESYCGKFRCGMEWRG
jgi:hypothetical protein